MTLPGGLMCRPFRTLDMAPRKPLQYRIEGRAGGPVAKGTTMAVQTWGDGTVKDLLEAANEPVAEGVPAPPDETRYVLHLYRGEGSGCMTSDVFTGIDNLYPAIRKAVETCGVRIKTFQSARARVLLLGGVQWNVNEFDITTAYGKPFSYVALYGSDERHLARPAVLRLPNEGKRWIPKT